ncbi:MAG: single-stranded DNA-binding protein [Bacillota bacterium]|nr:single-stranded DNA-binding protein [Bacillota bacterium]
MNKIVLSGRTTAEPSLRYTTSGKAVCSFTLAVKRSYKNTQGEYESDFINCQSWGKQGELIAEYVKKGQVFTISGRLQVRTYDKDGVKHWASEVVVEDFDFPQKSGNSSGSLTSSLGHEVNLDSDIPF